MQQVDSLLARLAMYPSGRLLFASMGGKMPPFHGVFRFFCFFFFKNPAFPRMSFYQNFPFWGRATLSMQSPCRQGWLPEMGDSIPRGCPFCPPLAGGQNHCPRFRALVPTARTRMGVAKCDTPAGGQKGRPDQGPLGGTQKMTIVKQPNGEEPCCSITKTRAPSQFGRVPMRPGQWIAVFSCFYHFCQKL